VSGRRILGAAACSLLLVAPALAVEDKNCQLRVSAIVATNSGRPEKELDEFHKRWRSLFHYSSYKLLKDETKNVKWRTRAGFDIPGGRYLVVSPRGPSEDGKLIMLKILVLEGSRPLADTVVTLKNEGSVVVAGPKHEEGILLLSIGARTETSGPWQTSPVNFGGN